MTIICKKYILKQQILQTLIFLNDITKINSNLEKKMFKHYFQKIRQKRITINLSFPLTDGLT